MSDNDSAVKGKSWAIELWQGSQLVLSPLTELRDQGAADSVVAELPVKLVLESIRASQEFRRTQDQLFHYYSEAKQQSGRLSGGTTQ
jgi:hypothetical protein